MTKTGNSNHHKRKNVDSDEKTPEAELERKYIIECFYDTIGNVCANFSLVFLGIMVLFVFFLPGSRYASSVSFWYWLSYYIMCQYISQFKATKDELHGQKLFKTFLEVTPPVHEIFQIINRDPLASEEGRNAHVAMAHLSIYFFGSLLFRISAPKYKDNRNLVSCFIMPLIAYLFPRYGVFSARGEALAFFVAINLGFVVGALIDEMRWRYFLQLHKKDVELEKRFKQLSNESRKRAIAMELVASYSDQLAFLEQDRWKA